MQKNYVRLGRKRRLGGLSLILGLSCLVALPSLCAADATGQIVSYQGLLSSGGAPVANGNQSLTFKIYENNAMVFTATQTVATVGGVFNAFVNIGNLNFDPAKTYELGITFNGTEARHPIAAVPVAKNAVTAETAKTVQAPLALSGNTTGAILSVTNSNSIGTAIVATGKVSASGEINSTSGYSIGGSHILGTAGTYNAFVGLGAGSANTTGSNNAFIGGLSGNANTSGGSNAFLGRSAGVLNTTGSSNAFVGSLSGSANTTGAGNAFVGTQAGSGNTSGSFNVFLGRLAGNSNTTGGSNIALGSSAGINLTTGSNNIAIGHAGVAGEGATTRIGTQGTQTRAFIAGISGVAITGAPVVVNSSGQLGTGTVGIANGGTGSTTQNFVDLTTDQSVGGNKTFTGPVNTTAQYTIGGKTALNISGTYNTLVGGNAGSRNTGTSNTFLGNDNGFRNTTGSENTFAGDAAGYNNDTGSSNTFIGQQAGVFNRTGSNNIALGYTAGNGLTTGDNNIAIGNGGVADEAATTRIGTQGTQTRAFIAGITGVAVTGAPVVVNTDGQLGTGTVDIANGGTGSTTKNFVDLTTDQNVGGNKTFTSPVNTSNQYNIGGGRVLSVEGESNTFVGQNNGVSNTTGDFNSFLGAGTGRDNTSGRANAFFGAQSGISNNTGAYNAFFGTSAGLRNTTGNQNSFLGPFAGQNNTTGSHNIALGYNAGTNLTTGDNNIAIGNDGVTGEANTIRIGSGQTAAYIAGISGASIIAAGGSVFIGSDGKLGTSISSSRRFKQDIANIGSDSSWLMRLRPVSYRYTAKFLKSDAPSALQYGLIAEEVAKVHPAMVHFDAQGRPDGLSYQDLPIMLLNEMQKQRRIIDRQQSTINEQQRGISELRTYVARLNDGRKAQVGLAGPAQDAGINSGLLRTVATRSAMDTSDAARLDKALKQPGSFNGVIVLDAKGAAVVTMPQEFRATGAGFSYQLTCIGGYAPVYVAQEIAGNHFKIGGGKAGMKVSWQVARTR